ncbi:FAST kinase domain-containing protein 1, mitochondrial isoform X2 [Erinaceus europaeus]|uniref:FAST kinase domain-containing protein 1, mitochondrial isoform X2 n=1 Tax=Erinaceus europaeus TaxID=9365 RepID=A0ABM3WB70_ERIEU|nr:FAST kinase domain-containing protein 1, mitochondrial isoform X2 [Erinaceus europaeus]
MLYLRAAFRYTQRVFQSRPFCCEPLISQMTKCRDKEQLFDLVAKNKAILSEKQVECALTVLWDLRKLKSYTPQDIQYIRNHPQYLTLQSLTAEKMKFMNDETLVNVLNVIQRFAVEVHDPLLEVLIPEAWKRLGRFDFRVLSRFSSCLGDQHLEFSPLMGEIADIVNRNLETIQDIRVLSLLMVNISALISRSFQERLLKKSEVLFDTADSSYLSAAKRIVQFLRKIKCSHYPLLVRCNNLFLVSVDYLDLASINKIFSLYYTLQFYSFEFNIVMKRKLTEMIPLCDPTASVTLFVALASVAQPGDKKRLESTILPISEDLTSQQALAVFEAMGNMRSRNIHLIEKIVSTLNKHLDSYEPIELLKIVRILTSLHIQNKELFVKLRELLLRYLKTSNILVDIRSLVCAVSMLPSHLDDTVIARIESVLPQCNLFDINVLITSVSRWIQNDHMCLDSTTGKQLKLLQKLDYYGNQKIQNWNNLFLHSEELRALRRDCFAESFLERIVATLQCLVHEINYTNVVGIASFISRTNYLSTLLLDKVASVVTQHIEKIHPFQLLAVLLPFSSLNYDPPQREEFFTTYIEYLNSHLGTLDPHVLVHHAYSLATLGYFPEDLLMAIFNIKFLAKLNSQVGILSPSSKNRIRLCVMALNRAVCLESPEYQIPWFHDRFCQQKSNKGFVKMNQIQQQIYKMLSEVLGETNCVKFLPTTPYYLNIDFECILDKRKKPIPYGSHNITFGKLPEMHGESNSQLVDSRLPPDAQRSLILNGILWHCQQRRHGRTT